MPTALIIGITGQDSAYLAQFLLGKTFRVLGLLRRSASSDVIGERLRWLGVLEAKTSENLVAVQLDRRFGL